MAVIAAIWRQTTILHTRSACAGLPAFSVGNARLAGDAQQRFVPRRLVFDPRIRHPLERAHRYAHTGDAPDINPLVEPPVCTPRPFFQHCSPSPDRRNAGSGIEAYRASRASKTTCPRTVEDQSRAGNLKAFIYLPTGGTRASLATAGARRTALGRQAAFRDYPASRTSMPSRRTFD